MDFSGKLKEIRKKEGLSQEQLAEKMGVSRQAVTKWETGKGMPDIENMAILAEIFKTTLDELISSNQLKYAEPVNFVTETIYDIDCAKHFDINIGSASTMEVSSGTDEKLHVRMESHDIEDIASAFKIKLDENKNRLDVDCIRKDRISRYQAEDSVSVYISLPAGFSDHCEVDASVKRLNIQGLNIRRLEYDGNAGQIVISESSGSIELTGKTDYDITVDRVNGQLDINQWRSKAIIHVTGENCPNVINKGRKCSVYFMKDSEAVEYNGNTDSENTLSISGIESELIIDMKRSI